MEDPVFSAYALQIKLRKDLNQVQGSAIKGITKNDLLTKNLLIPLREEQNKIGQLLKGLDSLITLHQRKCLKTCQRPHNKVDIFILQFLDDV